MNYLGSRSKVGQLDPTNPIAPGSWGVTFGPSDLYPGDFVVYHIALVGPGGPFRVYIDTAFYSASIRGDVNEYDPNHAMYVRRGQSIHFFWEVATGTAPHVTVYSRTPDEV